ncbi:MAG: hypothetical protein ACOCG5_04510 [Candidatus Alkaliphilus sp. MAG34]
MKDRKNKGTSRRHPETSGCVKNIILNEAKDLKWPKNEILRYTQNLHM